MLIKIEAILVSSFSFLFSRTKEKKKKPMLARAEIPARLISGAQIQSLTNIPLIAPSWCLIKGEGRGDH